MDETILQEISSIENTASGSQWNAMLRYGMAPSKSMPGRSCRIQFLKALPLNITWNKSDSSNSIWPVDNIPCSLHHAWIWPK